MRKSFILCAALAAASLGASAQDWRAQRDSQAQAQQQYQAPQPGSEHYNPELDPRSPTYKPQGDPANPRAYTEQSRNDGRQQYGQQYERRGYENDSRRQSYWSHNPRFAPGNFASDYRSQRYWVRDWRARRLYEPPRGYQWVETDTGEILLLSLATGLIANVILQQ